MTWNKYGKSVLRQYSECMYQKEIREDIFANIHEYNLEGTMSWELDIQIPEYSSFLGRTINVGVAHYQTLDFEAIEKDASELITKLI